MLGNTAEREKNMYQGKLKSCRKEEPKWSQGTGCNNNSQNCVTNKFIIHVLYKVYLVTPNE
jgi:hypothetical protein